MEGNRDVKMWISGEDVGVGGEIEDRGDWKEKEDPSNTTSWDI